MNGIVIIGGGGHAKVLVEALHILSAHVVGIVDRSSAALKTDSLPLIGDDDAVLKLNPAEVMLVNGVGSTGDTGPRREAFERFRRRGFRFMTVVHPSAVLCKDTILGEGSQIMAGAIIQPGVEIGENAIVNTGAVVDHDTHIGSHTHVSPGVTLSGGVSIGSGSHIGAGVTVIQAITIGEGSLVAAGAVVIRDVPERTRVRGVPANPF